MHSPYILRNLCPFAIRVEEIDSLMGFRAGLESRVDYTVCHGCKQPVYLHIKSVV